MSKILETARERAKSSEEIFQEKLENLILNFESLNFELKTQLEVLENLKVNAEGTEVNKKLSAEINRINMYITKAESDLKKLYNVYIKTKLTTTTCEIDKLEKKYIIYSEELESLLRSSPKD